MNKNSKKTKVSKKVIITRWLCLILAALMVAGIAVYTIQFMLELFAK